MYLAYCNIQEELLCHLDKQRQPLLEVLGVIGCQISGKELFNMERNLGWENLKRL